ncbi:MAG: hypothetical protein PVI90_00335 [Desulfobacteraceae bacterium]|jgi:hypothetical protein
MFKKTGQIYALQSLGLVKTAGKLDWILNRLARGRGIQKLTETANPRDYLRMLIGEPEQILHPIKLMKEVASLKPTREHLQTIRQHPFLWEKIKGAGRLAGDIGAKGFLFGTPAYGIYKGITTPPQPNETRGQAIGRAIGEGLGWFPPMGVVGTAASFLTPKYSLPALTGYLGEQLGRSVSKLVD